MESGGKEGETPVAAVRPFLYFGLLEESSSLGVEGKMGGKFHLKLNMMARPIAKKYCEGKLKRTLKKELKVPEIVERELLHAEG